MYTMETTMTTESNDLIGTVELFYDKNNVPEYNVQPDIFNASRRWFWDWDNMFLNTLKEKGLISKDVQIIRVIGPPKSLSLKEEPTWNPEDCCGNKESCCGGSFEGNGGD